jgi:polyhydroxyalkanoate synthesis regulator phasin
MVDIRTQARRKGIRLTRDVQGKRVRKTNENLQKEINLAATKIKPKSVKDIQNVRKTQTPKKMNTTQIKEELKKMQALVKKLDSQTKTKAVQFRTKKQKLKELQQHLKSIKPFKGITPQVRELATQEFVEHWEIPMPYRYKDARDLVKRGYYRGDPKELYQKFIDRMNPLLEEARVEVKKQIDGLQPKVDALESEISELKNKITALKAQYKSKKASISKPKAKPTAA